MHCDGPEDLIKAAESSSDNWLKKIAKNPEVLRKNYTMMRIEPVDVVDIFKQEGTMEFIKKYKLNSFRKSLGILQSTGPAIVRSTFGQ